MNHDIIKKAITVFTLLSFLGGYAAWIDTRYAKSSDLKEIQKTLIEMRVDQLRSEAREIEREAKKNSRPYTFSEQRRIEDIREQIDRLKR